MPIYGWNTAGGSTGTSGSQFTYSNITDTATAGAGETLDTVYAYMSTVAGTDTVDLGLYTFDGTWPDIVTAQGVSTTIITTPSWVTASFSTALNSGTQYCAALENNGASNVQYYYDSGSAMAYGAGAFPSPWTATTSLSRRMSIYGETSTAASVTIPPFIFMGNKVI